MSKRTRITLAGLVLGVTGMISGSALAVVPVNGPAPTLTSVTINGTAGDQTDPHVSGDWAAYTSDTAIRYYNFANSSDAQIPMGGASRDLLSDISGSKIAFSRISTGKAAVMVFDAVQASPPVELDAMSGSQRLGSAIGGNTVAYVDFSLQANGELVVHDLTTGAANRITFDTAFDQNPSVSPAGNVVVWERCATSMTNCDIRHAVKSGGIWSVGVSSDSADQEGNPDSNGALIVYDSARGGNADIFWKPVAGGAEVQLQLPGTERNPSIAGGFIAFESQATVLAATDIFVYDVVANRLYQISNTPLVNEQLNDITVLSDGRIRTVWASDEDGFDHRNIKGATFSLAVADSIAPVLTVPATITADATSPAGAVVTYTATATDNTDPSPNVSCSPASGSEFPIGPTTVSCTATDAAGNVGSGNFGVVVQYVAAGAPCLGAPGHAILQPINGDGTSVFKQGSNVSVKFRVCDTNGVSIGTPGVVTDFRLVQTIARTASDVNEAVDATTPDSAFRWSATDDQWIFNISTKPLAAGTTYVYRITLNDGSTIGFRFTLR